MKIIRPCKSTYYLVTFFYVLILVAPILSAGFDNISNFPKIIPVPTCLFILMIVLIRLNKITISKDTIEFKFPIKRTSILNISDVISAEFGVSIEHNGPPITLTFNSIPDKGLEPIVINAKLYSRDDISYFLKRFNDN